MNRILFTLASCLFAGRLFAVAPTAPTSLSVTALNVAQTSVTLQWIPGVGTSISTVIFQDSVPVLTTTGTIATVTGLSLNLPYKFYAVTKDINNLYSASSNTVTATLVKAIQFIGGQNVLMYGNVTGTSTTKPIAINADGTMTLSVGSISLTGPIPAGTNYIGAVGISNTVATTATISGFIGVTLAASNIALPVSITAWPGPYLGVSVTSGVDLSSVTITSMPAITFPSQYVGVSVQTGVEGISVTASQGSPWTVSGSVEVTSLPSSFIGVTVTSWADGYLGVSVVSGVEGISVTASQGSPWTVSGSVSVTNNQGLSVTATISDGITVTNTATNAVQIAGSITNTIKSELWSGATGPAIVKDVGLGFLTTDKALSTRTTLQMQSTPGGSYSPLDSGNPMPVSISGALSPGTNYIGAVGISNTVATTATISGGVSVTNPASAAVQIAGSITNTVTVGTHAVTQGGPWLVSGSVQTIPSDAYQGVTVFSGVAGLTVTASQGSPWTVSGSVGVSSAVPLTVNTHAVTQGGPWLVSGSVSTLPSDAYQGVTVFSGVAGLTVTASQGSPWTVSGSVGVTSGVAGLTVTASQGSPWTVSGSVSVTNFPSSASAVSVIAGVAGLTVTASQGSPWTVSGSVGVTSGVAGLTVTASQGSPWTVSGSVGVTSGVAGISVTASISGGVSVTNPASAAVQIAGSITNTVAISSAALTAINNKIPLATNTVRQRTVITAGTTETTILTTGGVGVFHDIDLIFVSNPDSNTDCTVTFRDATTGSIIFEGQAARAGGGFVLPFPVALPQATSNNNWTAEIDLSASPGIIINVVGHVRQ